MIKILAAIAGGALLAGAIVLLPGMTTIDPAATALAYGKSDRLDIGSYGSACSDRGWPYYEPSCIRRAASTEAKPVRVVTNDRLPADTRFAAWR
jgi:hypothetical protein